MQVLLQILGGVFYLLNKVFLSISERRLKKCLSRSAQKWRTASWVVYLIGLPPWVIIFVQERNWIAASVEASGAPAMCLGLVTAMRGHVRDAPRWLNRIALLCIPIGFAISLYDFGGITTPTQWLEIALVAGFLIGTYMLALHRYGGYLWYILMHVACGWLMWIQHFPWLCVQQIISLVFILDAYWVASRTQHE